MLFVFDNARDFGNDIAAALNLDPVINLYAEALNFVHVVQGGAADGGAADGNGLEPCDRSEFSRATHLRNNVFDLGNPGASRVFVGDRPPGSLSGIAEFF